MSALISFIEDFSGYLLVTLTTFCLGALLLFILDRRRLNRISDNEGQRKLNKTMIVLGSGGHTREILNLVKSLSSNFSPRIYVSSQSDALSLKKARDLEDDRVDSKSGENKFIAISRIREVGDKIWALVFRAPMALYHATKVVHLEKPDLVLCNGPGVCVPICLMAFLFRILRLSNTKIIFVESICRVTTVSLSAKFLMHIADDFIVQWEELYKICKNRYPHVKVHYLGRLA